MKQIINIQPVLIGSDINAYSMARAFHEKYGVVSIAFGKMNLGAIRHSRIIDFYQEEQVEDPVYMTGRLSELGKELRAKGQIPILIGCSDKAVELLIDHMDELKEFFVMPYMRKELKDLLLRKDRFYDLCKKHGMPHPKTVTYSPKQNLEIDGLRFPLVLKPTDTISYWKRRFSGMEKVYYARTESELKNVIDRIYSGGYEGSLIIQEYIPGDDTKIWTPTCYSDQNGKVKMMTLGHVLLEEHVPTARGNDAAILVQYVPELMEKLKVFLEAIGYVGFCNCDMKYDERDGEYKMFEVNIRQGRSNYHVSACGHNLAELIVEDLILNKELELRVQQEEFYWTLVPNIVVYKHVKDPVLVRKVKEQIKRNRYANTFRYPFDLKYNFRRWFYIFLYSLNHIRKFNKYYKQNQEIEKMP